MPLPRIAVVSRDDRCRPDVTRLGRTSVTYRIGLFRQGEDTPAATGRFVHVWVDRATQRPVDIPPRIRAALGPLADVAP